MSYILDALRKSEAQRSAGQPRGAGGTPAAMLAAHQRRRNGRAVALVIALIALAAAGGFWIGGSGPSETAATGEDPVVAATDSDRDDTSGAVDDRPLPSPGAGSADRHDAERRDSRASGGGRRSGVARGGPADDPTRPGGPGVALTAAPRPQSLPAAPRPDERAEGRAAARAEQEEQTDPDAARAVPLNDGALTSATGRSSPSSATGRPSAGSEEPPPPAGSEARDSGQESRITTAKAPENRSEIEGSGTPPSGDDPVADAQLPRLQDLSPGLHAQLPELTLNVHVYAKEPASRFVLINMQRYREGERVAEGLRLVEIRQTGVVLDYEGTRFVMERG